MARKDITKQFSNKVTVVSFAMAILVVFIHANNLAYYNFNGNNNSVAHILVKVFADVFGGLAVPFFFMMSAYWLFRMEKGDKENFVILMSRLKKKGKTVVVPYICWNTLGMLFYMIVTRIPFISNLMNNGNVVEINMENILKGIFLYNYYFPFWYLKDLIVLFLFSPIILFVVKKKTIAIISVCITAVLSLLEVSCPIFQVNAFLFFLIGGLLSFHYREWFERINERAEVYALFLIICSIIRYFYDNSLAEILFIISPVLMWKTADILLFKIINRNRLPWFLTQSFFVYAMHVVPVTCIGHILAKFNGGIWGAALNYIIAPIITVGLIYIIAKIMNRHFRTIYSVLCGERGK